jgi:hypothetical protein
METIMLRILNVILAIVVVGGGTFFYSVSPRRTPSVRAGNDVQIAPRKPPGRPWTKPIPQHLSLLNDKAWSLATSRDDKQRNGPLAIELATKACAGTDWSCATTLDTLAAAYAEAGRFNEAVQYQQNAILMLTPEFQFLFAEFQQRLELYSRGVPYRQ